MLYLRKTIMGIVCIALMLTLTQCKKFGSPSVLKVGVVSTMPPYAYFQDGEINGIDIDILREFAGENGYSLQLTEVSVSEIIVSVNRGIFDIGIGGISISEQRRKLVDFTVPYDYVPRVLATHKHSSLQKAAQLKERKFNIGIHEGTTERAFAAVKDHNVYEFKNYGLAVAAMLYGDIAGILMDQCTGEEYADVNTDIFFLSEPFFTDEYGFAVNKDCQEVLQKLNQEIQKIESSGQIMYLKRKHHAAARKKAEVQQMK